jgi:2-amino-4-hydroxy-6-hydroxymethyldihydropteridine diphosphokinase
MGQVAYLSLGSNVGDRIAHLKAGIAALEQYGTVTAVSSFYETEPVGNINQTWFVNCAAALETPLRAEQLLVAALAIERSEGRKRATDIPQAPRTLDIDLLLFGAEVIATARLTVPHPEMHMRRFVLEPLAEIASQSLHPLLAVSVGELLNRLPGHPVVRRLA